MAEEDDLDAFFEEVSEVEAKAVDETEESKADDNKPKNGTETDEPPAKRVKTSAPIRPRGVVVAASSSVVLAEKEREQKEAEAEAAQQQSFTNSHTQSFYAGRPGPLSQPNSSIGPATVPIAIPATNSVNATTNNNTKKKVAIRSVAGQTWVDKSLEEWPENDFRIFVGNLSNEVTDQMLYKHFEKYPSLAKARVVRDNKNPDKSKGYGFVSLLDPLECARALREMDQTWLSSRPIRIKRSDWKDRDFKNVKKREKKEKKQQKRMGARI